MRPRRCLKPLLRGSTIHGLHVAAGCGNFFKLPVEQPGIRALACQLPGCDSICTKGLAMREYPVTASKDALTNSIRPSRVVMKTASATPSRAEESLRIIMIKAAYSIKSAGLSGREVGPGSARLMLLAKRPY